MMLQVNKIFICMRPYCGQLVTFLHMLMFQVGVLRDGLLVLVVIKKLALIDYSMVRSSLTWVIVDFFQLIIDLDMIRGPLMEKQNLD